MAIVSWKRLFQEHDGEDDKQQGVVSCLLSHAGAVCGAERHGHQVGQER